MRLHHLFVLFSLAAISLLLTSCREDAEKEGRTIRIAHWWGDEKPLWDSVIAEFERTHRGLHVEQEVMSFNVLKDRILTQSAAGEPVGDLVPLEDWFAQELVQRDYFVDLAPMVARDLDSSQYYPISLGTFRNGETLRAWPVALGTYPLYYNADIFDRAGRPYPDSTWTYDTLLAVARQLTVDRNGDGEPEQWGFLLDNSGGFDGVIWSLGGGVLTADNSRSAFAEPRTVAALRYWVDLVRTHRVAPQSSSILGGTSSGGSMKPFETGRFAMALLGSHTVGRSTPFTWNIAPPPKGPGGRKVLRFAAAFGIPKSSKHPELAWEFIRWIVEEMPAEFSGRLFYGLVPNSTRLTGSSAWLQAEPKSDRELLIDLIVHDSFSYWRTKWLQFRDQGFLPEVDLMIAGEKSVEEGARDADRRINEVLGVAGGR